MTKKPIHIFFFIHSLRAGGAERVVSLIANSLVQSPFYTISILTFTCPSEKPFYPIDKKINLIHLIGSEKKSFSWLKKIQNGSIGSWNLCKAIYKMKPDVLVSFLDSINILALIVSRIFPTRLIVSERYDPQTYPRNWFIKVLRHLTYPWADKIIVQSSSVAMFLGKRLETKIQIIGNPVAKPLTLASQDVPKDNIHLVSVGRLIPSKRMDMVIRAFKKVKDHYPASQLTILGEGPERPLLEKIREDLGLTNSVFLPGTSSNIGTDLIRGQIFLFASESEGFPNALCEAMAAGLVPIITDYGSSARDIIQHGINGFLVGKNDLEGLSNFAITLIENKKLREKLSLEACKIAQTYSMEHIVGEWEKNILSLVGAKY